MTERYMDSAEPKSGVDIPDLLDIVKLDGRWAQVGGGGFSVRFLDNSEAMLVDWDDYEKISEYPRRSVGNLMEFNGAEFSENEIGNIHWGGEERANPSLHKEVKVFGEFKTKQKPG